ncbi:MAG: hypothetical protein U9R34_04055 [Nanoarchaeota archaeon]|nr:hypothetical protein [Nanoarchaeota archaeon]
MVITYLKNLLSEIKPDKEIPKKYISTKEIKEKYPCLYKKAGKERLEKIIDLGAEIYGINKDAFNADKKGRVVSESWKKQFFGDAEDLIKQVEPENLENILSLAASASKTTLKMVGPSLLDHYRRLIHKVGYDEYMTIANISVEISKLDLLNLGKWSNKACYPYLENSLEIITTFGYDELIDIGNTCLRQKKSNPDVWASIFGNYLELRSVLSIDLIEEIYNLASLLSNKEISLSNEKMKLWKKDCIGRDSLDHLKEYNFVSNVSSLIKKIPLSDEDSLKEILSATYDYAKEYPESAFLTFSYSPQLISCGGVKHYKRIIDFQKKLELNVDSTNIALDRWNEFIIKYGLNPTKEIVQYGNQLRRYNPRMPRVLLLSGLDILEKVGKDKSMEILKSIVLISTNNAYIGETILSQTAKVLNSLGYEKTIKWYNAFDK